jgi:hypothetical protein
MEAASTLLLSILEAGWIWWPAMFDKRPAPEYESRGVVGFRGAVWSTMW